MKNRKQVETRSFDPSGHARPTEPAPSSLESLSSQGTVVPELVAAAALFARGRRVDEGRIAELVGVSVLELLHPDQRRMADDLPNILFREASAGPNDLSHLAFSRVAPTTHLGQLEDIVRVAGRLIEGLEVIVDYIPLLASRAEVSLERRRDELRLAIGHPADAIDEGRMSEAGVSLFKERIVDPLGIPRAIKRIELAYGARSQRGAYEAHFGVPVRVRTDRTALIFYPEAAEQTPRHAHPHTFRYLRESLDRLSSERASVSPRGALARLVRAIEFNGHDGLFGAADAASRARLSLRSAQRIMAAHGTSLRQAVEEFRARKALQYLGDGRLDTEEIAARLGYADARAFRRAFARWTGTTPSEARRRLTGL